MKLKLYQNMIHFSEPTYMINLFSIIFGIYADISTLSDVTTFYHCRWNQLVPEGGGREPFFTRVLGGRTIFYF